MQDVYMSRHMTKPTKWPLRPAKTQISLGIHQVWSESSLCARWVAKLSSCRQRRLIRLDGYPGWSESSLGAQSFCWFCHCVTGWKKESFKLIHVLFHLQAFYNFRLYVFSICQTLLNYIAPYTELTTVQSPIVCSILACITVKPHAHL